jgi:hypothetical protein
MSSGFSDHHSQRLSVSAGDGLGLWIVGWFGRTGVRPTREPLARGFLSGRNIFSFFWWGLIRLSSSHVASCKLLAGREIVRGGHEMFRGIRPRGWDSIRLGVRRHGTKVGGWLIVRGPRSARSWLAFPSGFVEGDQNSLLGFCAPSEHVQLGAVGCRLESRCGARSPSDGRPAISGSRRSIVFWLTAKG